eukprot:82861_1
MLTCLLIFSVALSTALVAEGISWLLIYRTEHYKKLKVTIDTLTLKVERRRERTTAIAKQKSNKKKVQQFEQQLQLKTKEMNMSKFKAMFFVMFTMFSVFGVLNSTFDAQVVAKLPFEPVALIRGLTHRNLPGTDFTDCSMTFIYVLCSFAIRQNVQKFLGFAPAKSMAMNLFGPPPNGS